MKFPISNFQFPISKKPRVTSYKLIVGSSEGGQAILEVLVALAIGVIIATGFVSLGAISVRNSTFSKNQATATQLATEGIEAMITIRDQNTPGAIQSMPGGASQDQWVELFAPGVITPCSPANALATSGCSDFYLLETACSLGGPPPVLQRCIDRRTAPYTSSSWKLSGNNAQFSRMIRITDPIPFVADIKDVTVFVWWTDVNGLHTSLITRKLHRQRLE